jgi:hypothetical protein
MMLLDDLGRCLEQYVQGRIHVGELQLALAQYDQVAVDAARAGDERAEQLLGLASLLVAEYSMGHRSEQSVREEIAAELAHRQARADAHVADSPRSTRGALPAGTTR